VEANERTITASGDSRDELRPRSWRDRRDLPDQPHREEVQRRLDRETGLVYRAGRRRLEERIIPRELGSATW
jgi:hypothetical protein